MNHEHSGTLTDPTTQPGSAPAAALALVISAPAGTEHDAIAAAVHAADQQQHLLAIALVHHRSDPHELDPPPRIEHVERVRVVHLTGRAETTEPPALDAFLPPRVPVTAWWPSATRPDIPADTPLGRRATRRITDTATATDPEAGLRRLAAGYRPGDSDFAWTRLSGWRSLLTTILTEPDLEPVNEIHVSGTDESASAELLAVWLQHTQHGPVALDLFDRGHRDVAVRGVLLRHRSGITALSRTDPMTVRLTAPGSPPRQIPLPRRSTSDCLLEELTHTEPDRALGEVLAMDFTVFEDLRSP